MEEDFDLFPMAQPNKLFVRENGDGSKTYEYYFVGPIGEPEESIELCNALRSCNREDLFILRFNSGGGQVRTGNQILNALNECEATTVGYIEHDCGSMCTFLFLACQEYHVSKYAEWFSHTVQGGHIGGEHETFEASQFLRKQTHKRIKEEYNGFFTEDEIESLLKGSHYYLGADEIEERLVNFREYWDSMREECDCGECGVEDVTLEGLVKKAVKEAMAEINPSFINTINISQEDCDKMKEQFVESKGSGAIIQLQSDDYSPPKLGVKGSGKGWKLDIKDGSLDVEAVNSVSYQIQNGLPDGKSPETAYPYCPDSILEKGAWYKWEAGEDECPLGFGTIGSILYADGVQLDGRKIETYAGWAEWEVDESGDQIVAFKIDE